MSAIKSRNVLLLVLAQAFFLSSSMTMVAFAGLVGKMLSPDPKLATLPIALVIVATAIVTGPMSVLMQRKSRRYGFRLGAICGVAGSLLAAYAIVIADFWLFCGSTMIVGVYNASAQYYRFAAGESVPSGYAPKAMSYVLLGGIFAALIAPTLSAAMNDYFMPYTFMGVYIFMAIIAGLSLIPLGLLQQINKPFHEEEASDEEVRPLKLIMKDFRFVVAVINGAAGYMMMSFVMTATPLAMEACGFNALTSSHVIQAHVIAMFLPGLFTGALIEKIGVSKVLLLGQSCFALSFVTALSGIEVSQFSIAMVLLGIGWNFCFVGGSTLLTTVHTHAEKGRVQGLNEILVFSFTAVGSLASGIILETYGWEFVNLSAFILLTIAAIVTLLYVVSEARAKVAV